jgi:3-dehydrotetronate 4-kinase
VIGREIAPGVPLLHAIGARHAGLSLALKSGNFGGPDFFRNALAAR